jgi:hypothetical protein
VLDAEYDLIYYDFNSNTINNSVLLSEDDATLFLGLSAAQPEDGTYLIMLKLFDNFHARRDYKLELTFECNNDNAGTFSADDSFFGKFEFKHSHGQVLTVPEA